MSANQSDLPCHVNETTFAITNIIINSQLSRDWNPTNSSIAFHYVKSIIAVSPDVSTFCKTSARERSSINYDIKLYTVDNLHNTLFISNLKLTF